MTARVWFTVAMAALTLALAGCADSGSAKKAAAPSLSPSDVTLTITGASVISTGQPVVTFKLLDKNGVSYDQLTLGADPKDANLGATIAVLVPADGTNVFTSFWYNYLITTETKTAQKPGTAVNGVSVPQSTTEGTSAFPAGTLTYDKATQTYTYEFATNITTIGPPANTTPLVGQVAYQATSTHRVGLELRKTRAGGVGIQASAYFDFVPAGGTLGTRAVVADSTCNNACHGELEGHDGTRANANYCVMCHNQNNFDGNNAGSTYGNSLPLQNSLDFKVMVHRIHMGRLLPSVFDLSASYTLYGDNDLPHIRSLGTMPVMTASKSTTLINYTSPTFQYDPLHLGNENFLGGTAANGFAAILGANTGKNAPSNNYFPDCTKCHVTNASAQGNSWLTTPTKEACGSCHDNINFDGNTGPSLKPHAASNAFVSNGSCANSGCHNSQSIPTDTLHNYPVIMRGQAARFAYGTDSVIYNRGTGQLSVTFHIVKDGQNVDYTDFNNNPEFNPVAATATTMPGGLTMGCFAPPQPWTSCPNISVPGYGASLTMVVGWPAIEHKNDLPAGFLNNTAASSGHTINLMGTSNVVNAKHNGSCPSPSCTFTVTYPFNLPAAQVAADGGTIVVGIYGKPGVNIATGYNHVPATRGPLVRADVRYFDVSGGDGVSPISLMDASDSNARRVVVDETKCAKCHDTLNLHGQRNVNPQLCVICHNPNNTDVIASGNRGASGTTTGLGGINVPYAFGSDGQREQAVDFKVMIHGIHSGGQQYACLPSGSNCPSPPTVLEGFRSRGITVSNTDFSFINFPNRLSNCFACHKDTPEGKTDTFALPLASMVLPTTVTTMPPFSSLNPSGPQTQYEASRHTFGTAAIGFNAQGNMMINIANQRYVNSLMTGTGIPLQITIAFGSGAVLPTTSPQIVAGTPYYVVKTAWTGVSATDRFGLSTTPGGAPIQYLSAGNDGTYSIAGNALSPFTLAPYALADPTDDLNDSPTAAVCSSCHFDDQVKQHMVNTGGAVIDFPQLSSTGVTGIDILPGPMTDAQYRGVQSTQNGAGFETCSSCHGSGGVADVRKMHKLD